MIVHQEETNLHAGRRWGSKLLLHAIGNTREHSGATREDNVAKKIATDIKITLENGVIATEILSAIYKEKIARKCTS